MTPDRYEAQRRALIDQLRDRGVDDLDTLAAFDAIPRHEFLPEAVRHRAYEDAAVPIGFGQTASQPSLQAYSMQLLELTPDDKVLEVGTGSGHQTAVLSRLADRVYSIERVRELSIRAREALDRWRITNVALLVGDGTIGWQRYAPYDAILVAAAAPEPPKALLDQLAEGGRLLIPVGSREMQQLVLYRRRGEEIETVRTVECTFVPLLGRQAWPDPDRPDG